MAPLHGLVLRGPDMEACRAAAMDWEHSLRPPFHLVVPVFVLSTRATQAFCDSRDDRDGAIAIPFNSGGAGLLIYAIAAGGFSTSLRRVLALISLEVAILGFYAYREHLPIGFWLSMLLLIILTR